MLKSFWKLFLSNIPFKGRLNRKVFLVRFPLFFISSMAAAALASFFIDKAPGITLFILPFLIYLFICQFSIMFRRLHDLNLSILQYFLIKAGLLLIMLAEAFLRGGITKIDETWSANLLYLIFIGFLFFKKGTAGKNRFGDEPLAG